MSSAPVGELRSIPTGLVSSSTNSGLVIPNLPSAPGYIGIYQVACVLALTLYGIDQNLALAYSIVLHLVSFFIIGIQGILVTMYCGFNLSRQ